MEALGAQFSEALARLEEALGAIYSLTSRISKEIDGEQANPPVPSRQELLLKLFPEGFLLQPRAEAERRGPGREGEAKIYEAVPEIPTPRVHMPPGPKKGMRSRSRKLIVAAVAGSALGFAAGAAAARGRGAALGAMIGASIGVSIALLAGRRSSGT